MNEKGLNERQKKFLDLYLSGMMPTEAYQEAYGCSKRTAQVSAYRLLENVSIKEAIEEAQKRDRESRQKRLDKLIDKSINNIEKAIDLDENDSSLNFFKMMAIQHKTKTAENHLKRMGYDSPEKHEISGSVDLTWKEIIYGTAEEQISNDTKEKNN
jgi:phage terminase small subunit